MNIHLKMRPGTVLQFTNDTRRRTRSMTPGLGSTRCAKPIMTNWDTFFKNENSKLPLNAPVVHPDNNLEYSVQLKILKSQLDKTKHKWSSIESHMNSTKSELKKIENTEKASIQKLQTSQTRVEFLESQLASLKINLTFALSDYNSYLYVKKRMKISKVFADVKANRLRSKLKNLNEVIKEQEQRLFQVLNNNGKTLVNLKSLANKVEDEEKWRNLVGQKLDKESEMKNNQFDRRDEMQRRRIDIIESVANEDKNQRYNMLREGLLLHKTWSKFMSFKLKKQKEKFFRMENAHAKIRSLTGLTDVGEVVQKVLTREQSYVSMMNMILESKKVCDKYYERNLQLEKEMDEIAVSFSKSDPSQQDTMKSKIHKSIKSMQRSSEKLNKVKFVRNFVQEWVKNMLKKVSGIKEEGKIGELFTKLRIAIHSKIKKYEKVDIQIEYSPNFKSKKVAESEEFNFADLVYIDEDSSESSPQYDRTLRKRNTKKL